MICSVFRSAIGALPGSGAVYTYKDIRSEARRHCPAASSSLGVGLARVRALGPAVLERTRRSRQHRSQLTGVAHGVAASIVIEVCVDVVALPFPLADSLGPPCEVVARVRTGVQRL